MSRMRYATAWARVVALATALLVGSAGCGGDEGWPIPPPGDNTITPGDQTPGAQPSASTTSNPYATNPYATNTTTTTQYPQTTWTAPVDNPASTNLSGRYELALERVQGTYTMYFTCSLIDPSTALLFVPTSWVGGFLGWVFKWFAVKPLSVFKGLLTLKFLKKGETAAKVAATATEAAGDTAKVAEIAKTGADAAKVAETAKTYGKWLTIAKDGVAVFFDFNCDYRAHTIVGTRQAPSVEVDGSHHPLLQADAQELVGQQIQIRLTDEDGFGDFFSLPSWEVTIGQCLHTITEDDLRNSYKSGIKIPCNWDPLGFGEFVPDALTSTSAFVTLSITPM